MKRILVAGVSLAAIGLVNGAYAADAAPPGKAFNCVNGGDPYKNYSCSIQTTAIAQKAPTSQPTPSGQSFIERLINRSLTNAGAARGGVLEPGYRAEQEHRADRVG
jgi:hypothetical protein